jgi:hypothetical protein
VPDVKEYLIYTYYKNKKGGLSAILGCDLSPDGELQASVLDAADFNKVPDPVLMGESCSTARTKLKEQGFEQSGPPVPAALEFQGALYLNVHTTNTP